MKRILVISDTHCGHETGLTHPDYQVKAQENPRSDLAKRDNKFRDIQKHVWNWFSDNVHKDGPFDGIFHLGDNIDGRGDKNGGRELITPSQQFQCDMALRVYEAVPLKRNASIRMVYGTPYHACSGYELWEDLIASGLKRCKIGWREFVDVNGCIFDLRHKVGRSTVPYGSGTPIARQKVWNQLWAIRGLQPNANVVLRGHIHEYNAISKADWDAISLPAFQWSTDFGAGQCDGIVNVGYIVFEISEKGEYVWVKRMCQLQQLGVTASKL